MIDVKEIKDPSFLKDLSIEELEELATNIRKYIIEVCSKNGGHIGGNLGIVELTIALHKFFNNGEKFIFDVGHQCYTHKILTGRSENFDTLRKMDGISGFPSRSESSYDTWEVAHASTSLACQAGLLESNIEAISIIGDGALTGGEAIEALEYLSTLNKRAIIILNDNSFSISPNVGFIRKMLDKLRSTRGYSLACEKNRNKEYLKSIKNSIKRLVYKDTVFDAMGFKYYGPIDGHDFKELFEYFEYAKSQNRPVVLHVVTKKGLGYSKAEEDEVGNWHSVNPFDIETGEPKVKNPYAITYSEALATYLKDFYKKHSNLKVVMPAMTAPSNMLSLKEELKENYIDTGITEPFATSFSAALSLGDNYVCLPIYSSFMQRAYDQIHQDICLQNLKVVIVVDKSGIVPGNGKTHQGIYDISYLKTIPNLKILAPKDMNELYEMMDYAFLYNESPIAIHLPNNVTKKIDNLESCKPLIFDSKWTYINNLKKSSGYLITYSSLVDYIKDYMAEINIEVVNARYISELDTEKLNKMAQSKKNIYVYEEAPSKTSLYSILSTYYMENDINVRLIPFGFPLDYINIGSIEELRKKYNLDKESIIKRIKSTK